MRKRGKETNGIKNKERKEVIDAEEEMERKKRRKE